MSTHTEETRPADEQDLAAEIAQASALPETVPPSDKAPPSLPGQKRRRARTVHKVVTALVALALVGAAVFLLLPSNNSQAADDTVNYIQHTVSKRSIVVSLSGSGALQPADSYTVTPLVEGEILSDGFEEGDTVEKDAFLYAIDSTDLNSDIQRAENALAQTRKSYQKKVDSLEDLNQTASASGTVIEVRVEEGDSVMSGQVVAVIRDIDTLSVTLPFISDQATGFYVGQTATVTIDGTFEEITGTISKISAVDELLGGNLPVRQVTIDIPNPGGLSLDRSASAMVGDVACSGSGTFSYKDEVEQTAEASGKIASLRLAEGDRVSKGSLIYTLDSESLEEEIENAQNSLNDSELSLQNQYDRLENYSIHSPISGTIIDKYFKAGDNASVGKTLCVIYDLSYLTMTLNVDELDVSKVSVGQEVTITADAVSGRSYTGVVTKVSVAGTTSGGVTTYPVTIRIDETDGLLPGMNVDAEIIVMNRENVLAVPVSAVSRGNRVLVSTGGQLPDTQSQDVTTADPGGQQGEGMTRPEGEGMPQGFDPENLPEDFDPESMPQGFGSGQRNSGSGGAGTLNVGGSGLPEGFEYVTVGLGESDGSYIEVTEGLSEGDVIAYEEAQSQTQSFDEFQGSFGFGGMGDTQVITVEPAGGMPSGGGGGNYPGGGRQ